MFCHLLNSAALVPLINSLDDECCSCKSAFFSLSNEIFCVSTEYPCIAVSAKVSARHIPHHGIRRRRIGDSSVQSYISHDMIPMRKIPREISHQKKMGVHLPDRRVHARPLCAALSSLTWQALPGTSTRSPHQVSRPEMNSSRVMALHPPRRQMMRRRWSEHVSAGRDEEGAEAKSLGQKVVRQFHHAPLESLCSL